MPAPVESRITGNAWGIRQTARLHTDKRVRPARTVTRGERYLTPAKAPAVPAAEPSRAADPKAPNTSGDSPRLRDSIPVTAGRTLITNMATANVATAPMRGI